MKKPRILEVAALMTALALPLAAVVLDSSGKVVGSGAASTDRDNRRVTAGTSGTVGGSYDSKDSKGSAMGAADANAGMEKGRMNASGSASANAQLTRKGKPAGEGSEPAVRKEFRGFARRLHQVEKHIDDAEREGRMTVAEVRKHREAIEKVQAKFKTVNDTATGKLSTAERARMEAEVEAQESAVFDNQP